MLHSSISYTPSNRQELLTFWKKKDITIIGIRVGRDPMDFSTKQGQNQQQL